MYHIPSSVLVVALLLCPNARAQDARIVVSMTPVLIDEAIAAGQDPKTDFGYERYGLRVSTPFIRVATVARVR